MKLFTASLCTVYINMLFTDQVKIAFFQQQCVAAAVSEFIKPSAVLENGLFHCQKLMILQLNSLQETDCLYILTYVLYSHRDYTHRG